MKTTISIIALAAFLSAPAFSAVVYSHGHADFGVGYEDGDLHFHFHTEGGTVDGTVRGDEEFEIADVITTVSTDAMRTLDMDFAPLDALAGATIWVLPQVQNSALPYLGLATEELGAGDWGTISFELVGVTSPSGNGEFALWQTGQFGAILLRMSTADPGADVVSLLPGSHAHYNWAFTEPGVWEIEMTVSGTHVTDGFKSATETLTFHVVPEPSAVLLSGLGLVGLALRRRR